MNLVKSSTALHTVSKLEEFTVSSSHSRSLKVKKSEWTQMAHRYYLIWQLVLQMGFVVTQ